MIDLIRYFEGNWKLERRIELKAKHTLQAIANGFASFQVVKDENALHYNEEGNVFLLEQDKSYSFFRQFRYQFSNEGIQVYFADGKTSGLLYQAYYFDKDRSLLSKQSHLCGNDSYDSRYLLLDDHAFELKVNIDGDKKDLLITSRFLRSQQDVESFHNLSFTKT